MNSKHEATYKLKFKYNDALWDYDFCGLQKEKNKNN